MKKWNIPVLLFASLVWAPRLGAQVAVVETPVAAAPAAPTANLWSFLLPSPEQCARCKDRLCNSAIGEMAKSAAKPITAASGGLLFSKCGVPTAEDLAKMKAEGKLESEEGAAAKIKKSEAEAQARREAVRYLGTVDCNYWEEAKATLKNALRGDPNECVRYEAALALGRGCCCNKEIIEALKHSMNGSNKDGFPIENSSRVRSAAADAFYNCLAVYTEPGEVIEPEIKKLKEAPLGARASMPKGSQASMSKGPQASMARGPQVAMRKDPNRGKGLLGAFVAASATSTPTPQAASAPAPVAPVQAMVKPAGYTASAMAKPMPVGPPLAGKGGLLRHLSSGTDSHPASRPAPVQPMVKPAAATMSTGPMDVPPIARAYVSKGYVQMPSNAEQVPAEETPLSHDLGAPTRGFVIEERQ
jgi:hypothetical protein